MTKVEELRGCLWNKVFGADYAKMDELIDLLIAAAREEGVEREHARLFKLMQDACCYPINGDKMFAEPIPIQKRSFKHWWQQNMYGPTCGICPDRHK